MIHEKIFEFENGRKVKVIIRGFGTPGLTSIRTEFEILIQDPQDPYFHQPVHAGHPAFYTLEKLNPELAALVQIENSGISEEHINLALLEFEQVLCSSVLF